MKIKGRLGEYEVSWAEYGWTGAEARVYKKIKLFGIFNWNKCVWKTGPDRVSAHEAEKFYPKDFEEWFTRAVKQYEDYIDAWIKENLKN